MRHLPGQSPRRGRPQHHSVTEIASYGRELDLANAFRGAHFEKPPGLGIHRPGHRGDLTEPRLDRAGDGVGPAPARQAEGARRHPVPGLPRAMPRTTALPAQRRAVAAGTPTAATGRSRSPGPGINSARGLGSTVAVRDSASRTRSRALVLGGGSAGTSTPLDQQRRLSGPTTGPRTGMGSSPKGARSSDCRCVPIPPQQWEVS